jgi:hypothetical protein
MPEQRGEVMEEKGKREGKSDWIMDFTQ